MPPRWAAAVLRRVGERVAEGRVRFTIKALRELTELDLGLDEQDALDVLASLAPRDFIERLISGRTNEWMYVFMPNVGGADLYVKVILRRDCVVVSFHHKDDDEGA